MNPKLPVAPSTVVAVSQTSEGSVDHDGQVVEISGDATKAYEEIMSWNRREIWVQPNAPIDYLTWNIHTLEKIRGAGIKTLRDLAKEKPEDLKEKGFSPQRLREMQRNLGKYGLKLGMTDTEIDEACNARWVTK